MRRKDIYFGTGAGVNWIPTDGENSREINLRTLREIAETGVRDIQINFFFNCYYDLENYDAYLSLADELGLNVTFLFREVEAVGGMQGGNDTYHHDIGIMTLEEIEKYSNHFVYSKTGIIQNGKIEDALECYDVWFTDSQKGGLVKTTGYCYPRQLLNPFAVMTDFSDKIQYTYSGGRRGKYTFSAEGLDKFNGQAYTVLFEVRTPRFWVVSPVWDDEYYEKIYKGRHIKLIAEKCKFKNHPSVKCISTINEPTLTWMGGDIVQSSDFKKLWINFLKKEFSNDLEKLNDLFESQYTQFEDIPYIPRVIYSGGYHTHWSGVPGRPMNSEYEITKTRFKHHLLLIYYERTYKAVKELCGDFPVLVKYNWLNIDKMGEQGSGAYLSADSPWLDIIGWDMYPLRLGLGNLPILGFEAPPPGGIETNLEKVKPSDYIPTYTSTAAALPLMAKAYDKPGWLAETICGPSRKLGQFAGDLTELSFSALLKMGIDQVHYWAVGPWNRKGTGNEDPYDISQENKKDRIRPSLLSLGKVTQELKSKRSELPIFDVFLAYPEENVVLYNASDDGKSWEASRHICERCHAMGILSTDEVFRPKLTEGAKALAFYNGFYISDSEREYIEHTQKPVILLGHAFPTNPPFDLCYDELTDSKTDPFVMEEKSDVKLPTGEILKSLSYGLILPPGGVVTYVTREYNETEYSPFWSMGNRLVFGFQLADPNDYAKVIKWWLKEQKIIS